MVELRVLDEKKLTNEEKLALLRIHLYTAMQTPAIAEEFWALIDEIVACRIVQVTTPAKEARDAT